MPLATFSHPEPASTTVVGLGPGRLGVIWYIASPVRSRRCHRGERLLWRHRSPERDQHSTSRLNSAPAGPEHQKPGRAGEAIVLLVAVLVVSTLGLVPGQSPTLLGAELFGAGLAAWLILVVIDVRPAWAARLPPVSHGPRQG
jgi:hypothetical protein